jgi:hypothetical protein
MATQAHELRPISIGIEGTGKRKETDSMGEIEVLANHYWGAQTERSLIHFAIGDDHMPKQVYHAYGYVKKAAALVNAAAGRLDRWRGDHKVNRWGRVSAAIVAMITAANRSMPGLCLSSRSGPPPAGSCRKCSWHFTISSRATPGGVAV